MGQRLICNKCGDGLYSYSEPERKDWENREMTCENCGNKDTLKKMSERFWASVKESENSVQ